VEADVAIQGGAVPQRHCPTRPFVNREQSSVPRQDLMKTKPVHGPTFCV